MTKEEFNKLWKDSTREEILNQYYYDYKELQRRDNIINELENWLCEEQAIYRDYLIRTPRIASDYGERHLTLSNLTKVLDKLQELKGNGCNE